MPSSPSSSTVRAWCPHKPPYHPIMPLRVPPYIRNTISPTLPTRPTRPSSHPTKTALTSLGPQSLPTTRQLSQSSAGFEMLQPVPYVRAVLSPTTPTALANRASMTDASRQPDYGFNITTFAPANESKFHVDLVTFQEYSPCQFILQDFNTSSTSNNSEITKDNNNPVFSNIFAISVQNHSAGVTWSAENPAPEQTGTDGIGGSTPKSAAGNTPPVARASLVGAILVGLIIWT